MIGSHLKYFWYVVRHKWFVFLAGKKLGISIWQLLTHDLSKFSRAEWTPYVHKFYRPDLSNHDVIHSRFKAAVLHHYRCNPHHSQYWIDEDGIPQPMPEHYIREMLADWLGAGRAKTGHWDLTDWYYRNVDNFNFNPFTQRYLESIIDEYI